MTYEVDSLIKMPEKRY